MKKLTEQQIYDFVSPEKRTFKDRLLTEYCFKINEHSVTINKLVTWPVYVILFIPSILTEIVSLIWSGGLEKFELPTRYLYSHAEYFDWDDKFGNTVKKLIAGK